MNIYVRYFDQETLATTFEELIDFLTAIPEIPVTPDLIEGVRAYMDSPMPYPKRYKVRPRVYFILIKTTAQTMQEFKTYREAETENVEQSDVKVRTAKVEVSQSGWYEGSLTFKRVVLIPETDKCQYVDTTFSAFVHASSTLDCYQKIKDYVLSREDVDPRSQIPSSKSNYFNCEFIGKAVNEEVVCEEAEEISEPLDVDNE